MNLIPPLLQPFQPYLTYFALAFTVAIAIFKGFDAFMPFAYKSFITSYIGIPIYVLGYVGYKCTCGVFAHQNRRTRLIRTYLPLTVIRKTKAVEMHQMDLTTGAREFMDLDEEEEEDETYKTMTWRQKLVYNLKNW
jgi:yeast amino acid transporter